MCEMCIVILNCSQQIKIIQQLMRQNRHLGKKLKILRLHWSRKIIKQNKAVFYLVIDVPWSAQVNLLIDVDLLFNSKLKHCKLYHDDCN